MQNQRAELCQGCGIQLVPGGSVCPNCNQHYYSPPGVAAASWGIRFVAEILDYLIFFVTLGIGWIIWALIVFANGQTPGKALVGIRAIKVSGAPCGWGLTFVRELLIKSIVIVLIASLTFSVFWLLNYLWPLWDRNLQAIHDKMVGTVVVQNKAGTQQFQAASTPEPGDSWGTESESRS